MFSQIKKAADAVPNQDNSKKINALKAKIEKGEYDIDENKLAETISRKEFQIWSE
jgi:anti-sigma28 factor (negative regulator of flagellin synthesis)